MSNSVKEAQAAQFTYYGVQREIVPISETVGYVSMSNNGKEKISYRVAAETVHFKEFTNLGNELSAKMKTKFSSEISTLLGL